MATGFLEQLERDAQKWRSEETFVMDASEYDEALDEKWRIIPLQAEAIDKIFGLARDGKMYEAIATSFVSRTRYVDKNGRPFRDDAIPKLMKNPRFLDWWAREVRFYQELEEMADPEVEKKDSETTSGSTSQSPSAGSGDDQ